MNDLIRIARRYAEEYMNAEVEPAHLLRACLHPDSNLVDLIESLSNDYYYIVEWAEAQISVLDKSAKVSNPPLSERAEAVVREADNYGEKMGRKEADAICLLASLCTPGVGFSFEQLKTLPLNVQEILGSSEQTTVVNVGNNTTPAKSIAKYCIDLGAVVMNGQENIIGLEKEIATLYEVLGRKTRANVLITGESGVGKTSLVHGFVQRMIESAQHTNTPIVKVYELDLSNLSAGASYKGEVEDRAKKVFEELEKMENTVLVIESVNKVFDKQDPMYGIVNILKQCLSRDTIHLICTSTIDGFTKNIENDKEFTFKFEKITIEPPTEEQCFRIVKGSIGKYIDFHHLEVSDEGIKEAIRLAKRYMTERPLPASVFDLIDRTMSQVSLLNRMSMQDISDCKKKLEDIEAEKGVTATQSSWLHYEIFNKISYLLTMKLDSDTDFEKLESVDEKLQYLHHVIDELSLMASTNRDAVQVSDFSSVVAKMTGIPMGKVQAKERDKLANGEEILKRRVIGQDHAIKVVLDAVYESRSGLNKKGQPMGSFFFLGPTGTGKTELSKSLVEFLFGDETALIRFDMSEFKEEHSVALLYGAPPGYVGYEEGGLLVNKIRQNPYSVVLFDEIEKAHKSVFDLFLQILDEGKLHDRLGRVGDFSNALILFTSNIGSQYIVDSFNKGNVPTNNELMEIMQGHFRPEFLGRLTEIVPFAPISEQTVVRIFNIHLRNLCKQLEEQHITLTLDDESKRAIAMSGFNPQYGARPIIGTIRKELRRPLSAKIIAGEIKSGDTVRVCWQDNAPIFQIEQ